MKSESPVEPQESFATTAGGTVRDDRVPAWLTGVVVLLMLAVVGVVGLLVWSVFVQDEIPLTKAERDVLYYQDIVKHDPQDYKARTQLAAALLGTGKTDDALAEVDRALELEERSLDAYIVKATAFENTGRVDDAIATYEKAVELLAGAYEPSFRLAKLYIAQDRLGDAASLLDSLLEFSPAAADAMALRGQVYQLQGDKENARAMYERALEFVPDLPEALDGLTSLGS